MTIATKIIDNIYKSLLTLVFFIASKFRFPIVLKGLRKLYSISSRNKLLTLFDPNSIRKHIPYNAPERLMLVTSSNWSLHVDVNDHIGYWSYIRNEPFEKMVHKIAQKLKLGPDDVILDIGTNIGSASIPVCRELGCELIAVEASRFNGSLLIKNILANKIKAHLNLLALVNGEDGFVDLHLRVGNRGANSIHSEWNPSKINLLTERVPATTLDKLSSSIDVFKRVSLVKIDVEGAEVDVLKGGKDFFQNCSAPIIMEYRTDLSSDGVSTIKCILETFGPNCKISGISQNGNLVSFEPKKSYENILIHK